MSEKWFVVSESELEALVNRAREFEYANSQRQAGGRQPFKKAEAACRAREVPEWAKYFVDDYPPHGFNTEEIKR